MYKDLKDLLTVIKSAPLAVVECKEKGSGDAIQVLAALWRPGKDGPMQALPLARLFAGDVYEEIEKTSGRPKIIAQL